MAHLVKCGPLIVNLDAAALVLPGNAGGPAMVVFRQPLDARGLPDTSTEFFHDRTSPARLSLHFQAAEDLRLHLAPYAAESPGERARRLVAQGMLTPAEADRWADPEVMSRDLADLDESC